MSRIAKYHKLVWIPGVFARDVRSRQLSQFPSAPQAYSVEPIAARAGLKRVKRRARSPRHSIRSQLLQLPCLARPHAVTAPEESGAKLPLPAEPFASQRSEAGSEKRQGHRLGNCRRRAGVELHFTEKDPGARTEQLESDITRHVQIAKRE